MELRDVYVKLPSAHTEGFKQIFHAFKDHPSLPIASITSLERTKPAKKVAPRTRGE